MTDFNQLLFDTVSVIETGIFFLLAAVLSRFNFRNFFLEPIACFLVFCTLIYISLPPIYIHSSCFWDQKKYEMSTYWMGNVYSCMYILIVLLVNLALTSRKWGVFKPYNFRHLDLRTILLVGFLGGVPFLIGTLIIFKNIMSYPSYGAYMLDRINANRGLGPASMGLFVGYMLFCAVFADFLLRPIRSFVIKYLYLGGLIVFFLVLAVLLGATGNRLSVFIQIIMTFATYVLVKNKLGIRFYINSAIIGGSFLFLLVLAGIYRSYADAIKDKKVLVAAEKATKNKNLVVEGAFSAFGNIEHIYWLYENDGKWEITGISTFVAGFVNPVPRALWPTKPLGGGPNLKNMIYPGNYDLDRKDNSSYTTGIIVEAYMAGKDIGIIVIALIHALVLVFLRFAAFRLANNTILLVTYLYLLYGCAFFFLYGEFLGIYGRILMLTLLFGIIYVLGVLKIRPTTPSGDLALQSG